MSSRCWGEGWRAGSAVLLALIGTLAGGCAETNRLCGGGPCRPDAARGSDLDADLLADAAEPNDAAEPVDATAPIADAGTTAGAGGNAAAPAGAGGASAAPPAPSCATHPYRCAEACQSLRLVGGGRGLRECNGEDCRFELAIEPEIDRGSAECLWIQAVLTVHRRNGGFRVIRAVLQEEAWVRLSMIARGLEGVAPMSACSDCAASDEAWIMLNESGAPAALRYPLGSPPPRVAPADAFIQMLIDQLLTCSGDLLDQCGGDSSACRFTYVNTERQTRRNCAVGLEDRSPCRAAMRCLCEGDVLPESSDSPDACLDAWWSGARTPTLKDFCASSAPSALRTLLAAITAFGAAHQGDVMETGGLCQMIPAFY